jgi:hypothetical protein
MAPSCDGQITTAKSGIWLDMVGLMVGRYRLPPPGDRVQSERNPTAAVDVCGRDNAD